MLRVLQSHDMLDEFQKTQTPLDVTTAGRSLDDERGTWSAQDRDDPRTAEFLERFGWHGFSTGMRLRPGHHINLVSTLAIVDADFLQIWLDTIYQNMYSRRILDDGTRLLCTVGDCFAVGETHQATRHMRGALRAGAQPRELLEVIFQTTAIVGHPYMLPIAVDDLVACVTGRGPTRRTRRRGGHPGADADRVGEAGQARGRSGCARIQLQPHVIGEGATRCRG